jgi:hypothetical protein
MVVGGHVADAPPIGHSNAPNIEPWLTLEQAAGHDAEEPLIRMGAGFF